MAHHSEEPNDETSHETISQRAYEISQSPDAGTPEENWEKAERELSGGDAGLEATDSPPRGGRRNRSKAPRDETSS